MRIATFNVLHGMSPADGRVDLGRFRDAVAALDADVLTLQEVDRAQPRSHGADLTALAAEAMGAVASRFVPALFGTPGGHWRRAGDDVTDDGGPAYGCSLLSRLPASGWRVIRMAAAPVVLPLIAPGHGVVLAREEPRVALGARIDSGAGVGVTVIGTHLAFVPGWNRRQLRRIVTAAASLDGPVVVAGDLNLRGRTPAKVTGWTPLVTEASFPVDRPRFQLDHVLLRGELAALGTVTRSSTVATGVSDHRAVVVDVDLAVH